ncbi:MAG: heparinase II/III family protein [Chitinophagaceae bacterium]|nr:heparinase II/III family protein [Chitinophagaceae bacterium]
MNCLLKIFSLSLWLLSALVATGQRNILINEMNRVGLEHLAAAAEDYRPFPRYNDRSGWETVPKAHKENLIAKAEAYLNYDWAPLPATVFLEYSKNGNRSHFENIQFKRRNVLSTLMLAECLEHKGRFLENIVNGVWATCEESFWGVPAHISMQKDGKPGLPDVAEPIVDLFAAETGSLLSWAYYLLREPLDSVSPLISDRIVYEVNRRILSPNLERNDFWWMGYNHIEVNNWNPWICSNWLIAASLVEQDKEKKKKALHKIAECLDHFLNDYPDDGGCDEGPSYWDRAGGALFDCLEWLYGASKGDYNVFNNQLVKNIGAYIYYAHIDKDYFIDFADASARVNINPTLVYNFGKRTGNQELMSLGAYAASTQKIEEGKINGNLYHMGIALLNARELMGAEKRDLQPKDFWLPDLQVFGARQKQGSAEGFFLAGKGGHNAESHNHNDVGNFILYYDGKPVIIDIGVETYTSKTFSANRYDIWTMRSEYHNLPTINGYEQSPGKEYAAKDVLFKAGNKEAVFSLDIAGAYPQEAGVQKWDRKLILKRSGAFQLVDDYALKAVTGELFFTLITPCLPVVKDGKLVLQGDGFEAIIPYDKNKMELATEEKKIEDERLKHSWKDKLYRIKFMLKSPRQKDTLGLTIKAVKR